MDRSTNLSNQTKPRQDTFRLAASLSRMGSAKAAFAFVPPPHFSSSASASTVRLPSAEEEGKEEGGGHGASSSSFWPLPAGAYPAFEGQLPTYVTCYAMRRLCNAVMVLSL